MTDCRHICCAGDNCDNDTDGQPIALAIATAWSAGIMSVVAAGNDGDSNGLSIPACASKAVSVGAIYSVDVSGSLSWYTNEDKTQSCTDKSPRVDTVTCFSNR